MKNIDTVYLVPARIILHNDVLQHANPNRLAQFLVLKSNIYLFWVYLSMFYIFYKQMKAEWSLIQEKYFQQLLYMLGLVTLDKIQSLIQ